MATGEEFVRMVKVRNRSLFVLLLVATCLASPLISTGSEGQRLLAQVEVDNPDASEAPPQDSPTDDSQPVPEAPVETPTAEEPEPLPVPEETIPADTTPASPTFEQPSELPDGTTLSIEGSSSMGVITRNLIRQFQQTYPNASVQFTEKSAAMALADLDAGNVDLVATGRPLTDEQKIQGLTAIDVSREKIAVIVGASNPYNGQLEASDFVRIFRGEITNWSELGGEDVPIRFIDRPDNSDTRAALADYEIFGGDLTTGDEIVSAPSDSTSEVVAALGDNGISYAIASQVINQDNVRVLSMHNTQPDDPRYPYSQPRNYVYSNTDPLPVAVEAFLAFATNAQGREAVAQAKAAEAADVAAADLPDKVSAMRPDGQGFVTGDRAGNLNFWTIDGTPDGASVIAHTGPVTALAFSPGGERLISGGADGTIRLWDSIGTPIGDPINAGNGPVTSLVIQPDNGFISASADGTLQRWDDTGNPVGEPLTGHQEAVRDMALTPDGRTLVTVSKDGTVRRWSVTDGAPQGEPLVGHQGAVQALAVKPDGTFFSGGADGTVRRWDTAGTEVGEPIAVAGPVNAIAANADGTSIAIGDETGSLQYLSGDGVPVGDPLTDVGAPVDDLAFTPDGQRLVVSAGESPQLRDSTGQLIATSPPEGEDATEANGIPPALLDAWQRIRRLPPRFLWILPVLLLGLMALSILRSFQQEQEDDRVEKDPTPLPPARSSDPDSEFDASDFATDSPEDFTSDPAPDFTSDPAPSVTTEEAPVTLDASLTKAKQTLSEGVSLGNSGRYQEALNRFNKAIEMADMERLKAAATGTTLVGAGAVIARGLARRGTALANLGRSEEALRSLDRALEMDANDVAAWIGKGNVLTKFGQFDEAIFSFDKAIELNPNIAAAWQGKGKALQKLGRDAEARNCLAKADGLGGVNEDIPIGLGTSPGFPPATEERPNFDTRPSPPPTRYEPIPESQRPPASTDIDDDSGFDDSDFASAPSDFETDFGVPPSQKDSRREDSGFDDSDFTSAPSSFEIDFGESPETDIPEQRSPAAADQRRRPQTPTPDDPDADELALPRLTVPEPPSRPSDDEEMIGIISEQPQDPPSAEDDLPPDLLAAIENLPAAGDVTTEDTPLPDEIRQTLEYLPEEPDTPDPNAPIAEPIEVPPEVAAILAGASDLPSDEDLAEAVDADPMAAFFGEDPTVSMRAPRRSPVPESSNRPSAPITGSRMPQTLAPVDSPDVDQPEEEIDPALTGLPPDVIEALKGIPNDSPDSFGFPPASSSQPPPPPNNPRLNDTSS